eukprot:XP_024446926.1 uncharacterized protein LOC7491061 isoform X5 [Populus trichocarpa]
MGSSSPSLTLLYSLIFASSVFLSRATLKAFGDEAAGISNPYILDPENPALDVTPSRLHGHVFSRDVFFCERVKVSGHSRWKLSSYASSFRVTLAPSAVIPERLHSKIQVCFHRNASLGLCQCEKDDWRAVQKGLWRTAMSPYEERYVDVKFVGDTSGSVSIAVDEDLQQWRLMCLAAGFVLLLLASIVSSWVPFYYSTSMAIGVFLVIIFLLFQGMKLLPTGRKNFFYLSIYGSVLGAGTFVLHQTSTLVNSILVNFGLSEEMHYPVSLSLLQSFIAYLQLQIQENQCSRAIPATNTISPCKHSHIDTALNLLGLHICVSRDCSCRSWFGVLDGEEICNLQGWERG